MLVGLLFIPYLFDVVLLLLCESDRQHEAEAALHAVCPHHGTGEDMSMHAAPERKRAADGLSLDTRGRYPAGWSGIKLIIFPDDYRYFPLTEMSDHL